VWIFSCPTLAAQSVSQISCGKSSGLNLTTRDVTVEEFERTINVNLRAAFILTKGLVRYMRSHKWGRIIFVSSIAAQGGGINGPHYAASKGGLSGLMRNLSTRLAEYNISVNHLCSTCLSRSGQ